MRNYIYNINIAFKKLNKDNKKKANSLLQYISTYFISDFAYKNISLQIINNILQNQEQGINLKSKNDYIAYCDELLRKSPKKEKPQLLLEFINIISILFIAIPFMLLIDPNISLQSGIIYTSLHQIAFFLLLTFLIFKLINKKIIYLKFKYTKYKIDILLIIFCITKLIDYSVKINVLIWELISITLLIITKYILYKVEKFNFIK